jgi:Polyketide cyclase / dehydrase and lipid transport
VVESGQQAMQVRRFKVAPLPGVPWLHVTSREQTTVYEPPRHWAYVMLSGPPGITDLSADVTLNEMVGGGTAICWHVAFRSSIAGTGPALRWTLDRLYRANAVGLARAAQNR